MLRLFLPYATTLALRRYELHPLQTAKLDASPGEFNLNPPAQFARYIILTGGSGSHLQPHGCSVRGQRLDSKDAGAIQQHRGPRRIGPKFGCHVLQRV
jgi:hypothetical protein